MFDIEIADALTAKPDAYVLRNNISQKVLPATGSAEPDDETRTCEICVAINKVVYPKWNKLVFNHPHCKCDEKTYRGNLITEHQIKKVTGYLLKDKDKSAAMRSMGYNEEDALEIHEKISDAVLQAYKLGQYTYKTLDRYGQRVTVRWRLNGKRDHLAEVFDCHTGCVLHAYGKIRVVTPLIKD